MPQKEENSLNETAEYRDRPKTFDKSLTASSAVEGLFTAVKALNSGTALDKMGLKRRKAVPVLPDDKFKNLYQNGKFGKPKPKGDSLGNALFPTERLFDFKETVKPKANFLEKKRSAPKHA